jgi:epoxyqueuosine reductase
VCPWNKFARRSALPDFDARTGLTGQHLVDLFSWTEPEFLQHTEGSPIRRIGHERWLRNLAVGLGNALRVAPDASAAAPWIAALQSQANSESALLREHVQWALAQNPF